jgi:hypothetical protein
MRPQAEVVGRLGVVRLLVLRQFREIVETIPTGSWSKALAVVNT